MFSVFMVNTWTVATIVAVVAGVVGFFVVLRGSAFVADALPTGAFAGAAGASLIGVSSLAGLGVFSLAGALAIGWLGRRSRHDVATALVLVLMLGLGALFLSFSTEYAPEIFSLLFGEVLGISLSDIAPVAVLGAVCVAAIIVMFRPLMLSSVMPELGEARGVRSHRIEMAFLVVIALATSMALPVVGALLIFSLMIGPPGRGPVLHQRPVPGHGAVGRPRRRDRVGRHRRFLHHELAGRVLRRDHRRSVLRNRARLGGLAPDAEHEMGRKSRPWSTSRCLLMCGM